MLTLEEHHLIGLIYDAALDDQLWAQVIQRIVELSHSNSAIITALDKLKPDYNLIFTHNLPELALHNYQSEGLDIIDMEIHGSLMIKEGIGKTIQLNVHEYQQDKYLHTPERFFYDKCLKISNIGHMAGTLLEYNQYRWSVIGIHRPANHPAFDQADLMLLTHLNKHIRRSLQIHRQLTSVKQPNAQLYHLLDQITMGLIFLDQNQQVRYVNSEAEKLLSKSKVLSVTNTRHLKTLAAQQSHLNQVIRSALYLKGRQLSIGETGGIIELRNEIGKVELFLTVAPISAINSYREMATHDISIALFLIDPYKKHTLSQSLLKQIYGLSKREILICQAFINNPTLEKTAAECGLSLSSVRTYIKSIYQKTQQHSQAELLRLLMGMTNKFEYIH